MAETSNGETVRVSGSGSHGHVDCETFRVAGAASVTEALYADRTSVAGSVDVDGPVDGQELDVDGSVAVAGEVVVEDVEVDGTGDFDGSVRAERVSVDGSGSFGDAVSVDHLEIDGSVDVEGNLDGHEIQCDGSTAVGGSLVAADASFDGSVTVAEQADVTELSVDGSGTFGDLTAETVVVEGALEADDVVADAFEFTLGGDSAVASVEATEVTVEADGDGLLGLDVGFLGGDPELEVDTVEGERVDLAATRADTVAGDTVTLGPDVEVDVVYADDLDAADDATVGEVWPYGEY